MTCNGVLYSNNKCPMVLKTTKDHSIEILVADKVAAKWIRSPSLWPMLDSIFDGTEQQKEQMMKVSRHRSSCNTEKDAPNEHRL